MGLSTIHAGKLNALGLIFDPLQIVDLASALELDHALVAAERARVDAVQFVWADGATGYAGAPAAKVKQRPQQEQRQPVEWSGHQPNTEAIDPGH